MRMFILNFVVLVALWLKLILSLAVQDSNGVFKRIYYLFYFVVDYVLTHYPYSDMRMCVHS